MATYSHYTLLVSCWQLFIQIFAWGINRRNDFLMCTRDGWAWVYSSLSGNCFTLFHMMTILMQTIMVIKLFYWIPKKQGYFARDDYVAEVDSLDTTIAIDSVIPVDMKSGNEDDEFHAVI